MRVVHLPFYDDNPYQSLLMQAQRDTGHETLEGGGGGNFLRSALYRWKVDVIHFHWLHPYMLRESWLGTCLRGWQFVLELLILRAFGKRMIWTMHNVHSHDSPRPQLELFFRRLAVFFFHRVICHSQAAARLATQLLKIPEHKIQVVAHPNFVGYYPNEISSEESRKLLGIGTDQFVFLFLGRIASYKGVESLIKSFSKLDAKSIKLLIVGAAISESYADDLRKLANGDCRIQMEFSRVGDDRIQVYMNAANVLVLPFKKILTSGSAILGMGFGKPIIATRDGGLTEVLVESPLLYHDALLTPMKWAIQNSSQLDAIGAENRTRIDSWLWEDLAKACL